jgi:hypothetical protein
MTPPPSLSSVTLTEPHASVTLPTPSQGTVAVKEVNVLGTSGGAVTRPLGARILAGGALGGNMGGTATGGTGTAVLSDTRLSVSLVESAASVVLA